MPSARYPFPRELRPPRVRYPLPSPRPPQEQKNMRVVTRNHKLLTYSIVRVDAHAYTCSSVIVFCDKMYCRHTTSFCEGGIDDRTRSERRRVQHSFESTYRKGVKGKTHTHTHTKTELCTK